MLTFANYAVLACAFLTALASAAVYFLTQASDKEKERGFEAYKLDASRQIALAHEGAEQARADAANARADAERAKLETARVSEKLLLTQDRLDHANSVTLFTPQQVDRIVHEMAQLPLEGTQPIAAAANDPQAQRRLSQLTIAFMQAERRLYTQTTGFLIAPAGEHGDILIHYWSDDRRKIADSIASIFRSTGLETNVYKLPPEVDTEARHATQNMVLIGIPARPIPTYREHE